MTILVLCNVGSRDVRVEGQAPSPAREEGWRLLQAYDEIAPALTFPIVQPCLGYILAQQGEGIERLVLFGTDQPDPAYRSTDTLYFAQLAARRLPEPGGRGTGMRRSDSASRCSSWPAPRSRGSGPTSTSASTSRPTTASPGLAPRPFSSRPRRSL